MAKLLTAQQFMNMERKPTSVYTVRLPNNNRTMLAWLTHSHTGNKTSISLPVSGKCLVGKICPMCVSGKGNTGNYTGAEIYFAFNKLLEQAKREHEFNMVRVFFDLGGEPLMNVVNILRAIKLMQQTTGVEVVISLTTIGIPDKMVEMANRIVSDCSPHNVHMKLSIHAFDDVMRRRIIPVASTLEELAKAMHKFIEIMKSGLEKIGKTNHYPIHVGFNYTPMILKGYSNIPPADRISDAVAGFADMFKPKTRGDVIFQISRLEDSRGNKKSIATPVKDLSLLDKFIGQVAKYFPIRPYYLLLPQDKGTL